MTNQQPLTFLCISCYYKGVDFLKACKAAGNRVYLVTSKKLENENWPKDQLDDIFYMNEDENGEWNLNDLIAGTAFLFKNHQIDRVVALDDFDVEKAALVRESFRIPGMGQTTARYFRDKLAMRMKAQEEGIRVPGFSGLFNDELINQFIAEYPGPWVVKPRSEASATGIKKVHNGEELWQHIHSLGEHRHEYLVEQFKPGDVYHVDSLSNNGKLIFCRVSQYLNTPFEVAHGGGVFLTHTVEFGSEDDKALQAMTSEVMKGFGMQYSASHSEFIKCHEDGQFYFLETSSRVGGAHIAEMVTYSSGINLWSEWAKLETAVAKGEAYQLPTVKNDYAGLMVSLSRFEHPDHSVFNDPEVVWNIDKSYHVGVIMTSDRRERILELLNSYAERVFKDFHAAAPAPDKSTH
ncbi:MAG: ATP-grasp domain-containing protein [Bacteroidota bacterium]